MGMRRINSPEWCVARCRDSCLCLKESARRVDHVRFRFGRRPAAFARTCSSCCNKLSLSSFSTRCHERSVKAPSSAHNRLSDGLEPLRQTSIYARTEPSARSCWSVVIPARTSISSDFGPRLGSSEIIAFQRLGSPARSVSEGRRIRMLLNVYVRSAESTSFKPSATMMPPAVRSIQALKRK